MRPRAAPGRGLARQPSLIATGEIRGSCSSGPSSCLRAQAMGSLECCTHPDIQSEEGFHMTTAQDKIAQDLQEAHAMELALAPPLQAHSAMTPTGPYRTALERHRRETQGHADRVARRLRD